MLFFFVMAASMGAANLLFLLLVPFWAGLSLGAAILTFVTLWAVYLSLIGNVNSAKEYPENHPRGGRPAIRANLPPWTTRTTPTDGDVETRVRPRKYLRIGVRTAAHTLLEIEGMMTGKEYRTHEMERN
ncbi:hypothetical protein ACFFQF_03575 [Haladaptatus pallidirubidus]|uniref:hypothetical protein n=1 Tax=Haladaptatus pallidirubidus TaxID=1008152 RepID=UPI0035ED864A